jgi:hypothetical protein
MNLHPKIHPYQGPYTAEFKFFQLPCLIRGPSPSTIQSMHHSAGTLCPAEDWGLTHVVAHFRHGRRCCSPCTSRTSQPLAPSAPNTQPHHVYHVQAVRTRYPAGLSSRALTVAPISELPRSPAPPLIPPELMSSVSAGLLLLPFIAVLITGWGSQAVRTWHPAGLSSRALPIDPSAWAVAPISELPRSPAPPLIPPELMSSVSADPLLLPFIAVLITGWGSQGATLTWTRDLFPRGRTQRK